MMKYLDIVVRTVVALTAFVTLEDCSAGGGASSSTPASLGAPALRGSQSTLLRAGADLVAKPDRSAGFAAPNASSKAAFIVSDSETNDISVFTIRGKLLATITGFSEPQGIAADSTGNVYVANTADSNIIEYANDYKTRKATFKDPGQYPAGVAIAKSGVVGVTNILNTSGGSGSVTFYAKGHTTPCVTVANASLTRIYFGAFDAAGNFYIDGESSNGSVLLGVARGGCSATQITLLQSKQAIGFPGSVLVSTTDRLVLGDQENSTLYTFNLPTKNVLGSPIATTVLGGGGSAEAVALTANGHDLWATLGSGDVDEYAYPAGGQPIASVNLGNSDPGSLVVLPVAQP